MSKDRPLIRYVADFETTTDPSNVEVWSAAYIDLALKTHPDNVKVVTNIDDFMEAMLNAGADVQCYFHNLKFDGSFVLSALKSNDLFTELSDEEGHKCDYKGREGDALIRTRDYGYIYNVNDMGQWYSITVVRGGNKIEFRDSLKLLPFSVKSIGKNFKTKYQKLEMNYDTHTARDQEITEEEMAYIKNDVLVMHEAMNIMFERGMDKLTIGSCCLSEFKKDYKKNIFRQLFPDLTINECPIEGFKNTDEYIRRSYHGGWCYLKEGCENKIFHNGITCDVNSLYPSMMHSDSGNRYPIGYPTWWTGNEIPDKATEDDHYFFVRFRCFFDLYDGQLPTIQIKGHPLYKSNEWLSTSRVKGERKYIDMDGNVQELKPELVMTCTDFYLFLAHYDVEELEILDGCYFSTAIGIFDEYINYWSQLKINATNPVDRQIAKLMLNNLYGKFAASNESSYKMFELEDGVLKAHIVEEFEKQSGYIPIGSAITSYARNFTITAAQENYEHFIYADTDSIHCADVVADDIKGAPRHATAFNHWKYEASWDVAIFVRQKTYIEHVTQENLEDIEEPYFNIKCAGMGEKPREELEKSLIDGTRTLTDFKKGLTIEGNLKAHMTNGGTVLVNSQYKMH